MTTFFHRLAGPIEYQSMFELFIVYETILRMIVHNRFYYGHVHDADAAIVMGDFGVDGWKMPKKMVNLSLDHILVSGIRI